MDPMKHTCTKCGREFESKEQAKEAKCPVCGSSQAEKEQQASGCGPRPGRFK